jgi:CDP-4-dehydro-6-deoxyglucose reductase
VTAPIVTGKLTGFTELVPGTRHFEFESPNWEARFVPGQFLSVSEQIGEEEITRAYSIASPPGGNRFALCANLVGEGHLTPFLFDLRPGDEIHFRGPYGAFIPKRPVSDSILVATGTGIAPFRSMLHSDTLQQSGKSVTLVFGVRHEAGLLYNHEWKKLAAAWADFAYHPTLTSPPAHWKGRTGRVQKHVLELLGDRREVDIYICGMKEMVDDLRAQLKAAGVDRKRIVVEKYD